MIPSFLCPSDPQGEKGLASGAASRQERRRSARTNMAGVSDSNDFSKGDDYTPQIFRYVDGIFGDNRLRSIAEIRDGTSNTLMVGEMTGGGKGTADGNIWASANICDTTRWHQLSTLHCPWQGGTFHVSAYRDSPVIIPAAATFAWPTAALSFLSQNIYHNVLTALTTRDGANVHNTGHADQVLVSGPP